MKNVYWLVSFFLISLSGKAQNFANDCVNAIVICGNGNLVSNSSGYGNNQEVNTCGSSEHNSLWIKINIVQGGTLGFNLVPSNPAINIDYDFWVFGANKNCGTSLGAPIRCNTVSPLPAPNGANLASNITGMDGSTLTTQSGPGPGIAGSTGYVRWLDVLPGQFYYIVIDRPEGESGFELQWIGTAMNGTGAFPVSPTANAVPDYKVCSSSAQGIFDLNTIRPIINSDVSNIITFHETYDLAFDGFAPLPDIINNTANPQVVFAKIKNSVSGCTTITSFNLVVNPIPTATMTASATTICSGENVTITFNGTPNSKVQYRIDSGTSQTVTLSSLGSFSVVQSFSTTATIQIESVKTYDNLGQIICTQIYNSSIIITVRNTATIAVSGPTVICQNTSTAVTFTGTPGAVFTYKVNGGTIQSGILDGAGTFVLTTPNLQSNTIYEVVTVAYNSAPICVQNSTANLQILVRPTPSISISGSQTVCFNATTSLLFSGTPSTVVLFTDGVSNFSVTLNAAGEATFNTNNLIASTTFTIQSTAYLAAPFCTSFLLYTFQISVIPLPTATISGANTICEGATSSLTFQGTPNATITFVDSSGTSRNLTLNALGSAFFTTPNLVANTTYTLTNAILNSNCSNILNASVIVSVLNLPTASISAAATVCYNETTTVTFTATPNTVLTYKVNGMVQTVLIDASGTQQIITSNLTTNAIYELVSITITGSVPNCTKFLSTSQTIAVTPLPTVLVNAFLPTICSGNTTSIGLNSTVVTASVTFQWVASLFAGPSGGTIFGFSSDTSGTGTTIAQTLQNTGTTIGIVRYTIIPYIGLCAGTPVNVDITVNAVGNVNAILNETVCNNSSTISVNFSTTNTTGTTTYSWINDNPAIGLAPSSAGSISGIPTFVATNTTTLPITGNIIVTPTFTNAGVSCTGPTKTYSITVNPTPNVTATPMAQTICTGEATNIAFSGAVNNTIYSWTVLNSVGVSGALNGSGSAINQFLFTTTSSQGLVVYEVFPSINGCIGTPKTVTVAVNPVPTVVANATYPELCSGEFTSIPLTSNNAATVFNWVVIPVGVSGASAGSAAGSSVLIAQPLIATGIAQGYVDYIITPLLNNCSGTSISLRIFVNPLPVVSLTNGIICIDAAGVPFQTYLLDAGLNAVNFDFLWTFQGAVISGATNATYIANAGGTYTVVATNKITQCVSNIAMATVTTSSPAANLSITQTDYFSNNATLVVNVNGGNGSLLYQLDQEIAQNSNVFSGVNEGTHTVTVTDSQGCTYLTAEVFIIDYPKYFTPNGDGYNDTWNIFGLNQPLAKIYIFDRFGKLLKQITPSSISQGWDGTYNNAPMPATDYWFVIDYVENGIQKQFKAHFSLKR